MTLTCTQATVETFALRGVEPIPVEVQVDVSSGLPSFIIVGMADAAVLESRDRVRSALRAAGYTLPSARLTVNLAPAPVRKHGTGFDLPIAVAILVATGQLESTTTRGRCFVGELALDGSVRPVVGLLGHALGASRAGLTVVGPPEIVECAAAMSSCCVSVQHLSALEAQPTLSPAPVETSGPCTEPDFGEVVGQEHAKRALEIAATGHHNVLMIGPPGSGKSMLASRLPSILPELTLDERRASALVHSVAGLNVRAILAGRRPFRAPHHTATTAGLCGGGVPPTPGEVSLAHNGVLFLDEISQLGPAALQALRQPLEEGTLRLVRADGTYAFPAAFMLVAAANPCPCGYHGDTRHACRCTPARINGYQHRIGGPLLDRMDMRLRVDPEDPERMMSTAVTRSSAAMRKNVERARSFGEAAHADVSSVSGPRLVDGAQLSPSAIAAVGALARRSCLSGRGLTRLLRVARSVADLDFSQKVEESHIDEAFAFRGSEGASML